MAHHIYMIEYYKNKKLYTKAVYGKLLANKKIVYNTEIFTNNQNRTALFKTFDKKIITCKTVGFYYDYCINYNCVNIPRHICQYHKKQNKYKTIKKNNIQSGDFLYIDNGKTKKVIKLLKTIKYVVSKMEFYKFYRFDTQTTQETLTSIIDSVMDNNAHNYPNVICVKLDEENKMKYL